MPLSCTRFAALIAVLFLAATQISGQEMTDEELEKWFNEDDDVEMMRALQVNEGKLVFLDNPPAKTVHHHHNTLIISPRSLYDGWVRVKQCHENIDQVPRAQVLFREKTTRNLQVRFSENIEKAWVEGPSVQLVNVTKGARLCLEVETRSLEIVGDGTYTLRNGPFMRRFLDGYYPMHVSMDVIFESKTIAFLGMTPGPQTGFRVWHTENSMHYDTWFEGRLTTEIHFTIIGSQ